MVKVGTTAIAGSVIAVAAFGAAFAAHANSMKPVAATAGLEARPALCAVAPVAINSPDNPHRKACTVVAVRSLLNLAALTASDFGDIDDASR